MFNMVRKPGKPIRSHIQACRWRRRKAQSLLADQPDSAAWRELRCEFAHSFPQLHLMHPRLPTGGKEDRWERQCRQTDHDRRQFGNDLEQGSELTQPHLHAANDVGKAARRPPAQLARAESRIEVRPLEHQHSAVASTVPQLEETAGDVVILSGGHFDMTAWEGLSELRRQERLQMQRCKTADERYRDRL